MSEANGDGSSQIVARRRQKSKRSTGAFASAPLASTERQIPTLVEKFAVKEEAPRRHLVPGTDSFRTPLLGGSSCSSWCREANLTCVPISHVVRLPFNTGPFDQSRERCDGSRASIWRRIGKFASSASSILHNGLIALVRGLAANASVNPTENCRNCLAQRMGRLARHCAATPADVAIRTDQHGAGPIKIVSRHECFIVDRFCLERK